MTIDEIQNVIMERAKPVTGIENEKVNGARYISNCEVMDWRAGRLVYLHKSIVQLFDRTRETLRRPLLIGSGFRSSNTQKKLITMYGKAKKSPHTMGCALDIDTENMEQAIELQGTLNVCSEELFGRIPRVGIKKYKGNFVHVDTVFFLFEEFGGEFPWPTDYDAIERNWRPGVGW